MNRNLAGLLAATAGLALPMLTLAVAAPDMVVLSPRLNNNEFIGPVSVINVQYNTPASAGLVVGQAIDRVELFGINAAGARVTTGQDVTPGIGGAPIFAATTTQAFTVDIALAGAGGFISAAAGNPNIAAIEVVCSTEGAPGIVDGVGTRIDVADESLDEALVIDTQGPKLLNVFTNAANDRVFFVFDEALQGAGGPGTNDTNLANVNDTSFQFLVPPATNAFFAATLTPNGAALPFVVDAAFVDAAGDANTTIGVGVTATNFPIGTFFRPAANDAGNPTHTDIFDLVGNEAFQCDPVTGLPLTTGIATTSTPSFAVASAEWVSTILSTGGAGNALRVTFNLPVSGANLGDADYYSMIKNSLGTEVNTDADADPDFVLGAGVADPSDTSSVLVPVTVDGTATNDAFIWGDGLSTDGQTFQVMTDITTDPPNVPQSIFSDPIALANTTNIGDGRPPALLGHAFLDQDGDGSLDGVAPFFDEPVTSDLAIGDVELNKTAGTVNPFAQITADGDLTADAVVNNADPNLDEITVSSTGAVDVRTGVANAPERLHSGNGQVFSFDPAGPDWDEDTFAGALDTDGEATPGTGDGGVLTLDFTDGTFSDPGNNDFMTTFTANPANVDRATPVFVSLSHFEGDNQQNGSNVQFWRELNNGAFTNPPSVPSSSLGDNQNLDRLALVFGENMVTGAFDPTEMFVDGAPIFTGGSTRFATANAVTIVNNATASDSLAPGASVTVRDEANLADAAGNAATVDNATATAGTSPFVAYQLDVAGNDVHGAVLVDTDGDGVVDEIHVNFNENINVADLELADFDITSPTSAVATGLAAGSSSSEIVITLDTTPAKAVSTVTTVTLRYNSAVATPLISGPNGAVSQLASQAADNNAALTPINALVDPAVIGAETDSPSSMLISGTINVGGSPAPIGTIVYGMIAVPTVDKIIAIHNGIAFTYERDVFGDTGSFEAITNWLFGYREHVYLHRFKGNEQQFTNFKDDGEHHDDGEDFLFDTDIIDLEFSFRSFDSITFRGTGEQREDTVSGSVEVCWDVLRSSNGTTEQLFRNGFDINDAPILSRAVVTGSNGNYEIEVGGPITGFTGIDRVDSTDFPVILIVQTPNGERCAVSSVLNAADGNGPILFQPTVRSDTPSTFDFDVNLDNVGKRSVYRGWNTVGFDRASGVAESSLPTLPNGVLADDVQTGLVRDLPGAGPLEQFCFWDDNGDGVWDASDDGSDLLDSIIVDADCVQHFAFTMTNLGVQFGDGMTNLVGGYGFGFFNGSGTDLGVCQFGPPIAPGVPFSTFPSSNTNLGWVLATATQDTDVSGGPGPLGGGADFAIEFLNDDGKFFTRSSGTNSHGDLENVPDGSPVFIHFP